MCCPSLLVDGPAGVLMAIKAGLTAGAEKLDSWANEADLCTAWDFVTCEATADGEKVVALYVPVRRVSARCA